MKKFAFVLALLVGASSFAQGGISQGGGGVGSGNVKRGSFLKPGQYATQGSLALFVDGALGNDSNACTASGASACLTIQGAIDKIPFLVQHPVTVDIAAGSYGGFAIQNKSFVAAVTATGAYINVRGAAQINVVPATGSATGTIASVTTDAVGFHVVTVTAAGWTVNDFTGRFLTLTGGSGSGQICPIISNTATTITVSCTFSPAPVGLSTTFAVTSPSVSVTTSINLPASADSAAGGATGMSVSQLHVPRGNAAYLNVQDIEFTGAFRSINAIGSGPFQLVRIRAAPTNQNSLGVAGLSMVNVSKCAFISGSGTAIFQLTATAPQASRIVLTNSVVTSSSAAGTIDVGSQSGGLSVVSSELATTAASGVVVLDDGAGANLAFVTSRIRCDSTTGTIGVWVVGSGTQGVGSTPSGANFTSGAGVVTGCATGMLAAGVGKNVSVASTWTFLSNTLALSVTGGGKAMFTTAVPTFTTNTTDISVDGVTSTRAAFVALTPNSIVDMSYLSAVYLQP